LVRLEKKKGTGFNLRAIGVVHTEASENEIREGDRDIKSTIEIYPRFKRALKGIDGFSNVFVICYFNKLRPEQMGVLQVRPRRFLRKGLSLKELPLVGVFALNSPSRPNPIGMTQAKVLGRRGRRIFVRGLDYFDGTPVLDIKPYHPHYRVRRISVPNWSSSLERRAKIAKERRKRA
jgi:tRNA-Thr(GGU) m(6)t(6)A37 methyltransferase TsaA